MTISRKDPATPGPIYDNASFPANSTVTVVDFSSYTPAGGIDPQDELVICIAYYFLRTGSMSISSPSGWTLIADSPGDNAAGSPGSQRQMSFYYRRADGSGLDTPTFSVTHSGTSTTRECGVHACMWAYTGQKMGPLSSGSEGSATRGGPTSAFTQTVPPESVFIGAAYQTINDTVPSLSTAHGFSLFYNQNPSGSPGAPQLSVADNFPMSGTVSGPEWSVSRGTSVGENHDLWATLKKINGLVRGRRMGVAHGLHWAGGT